VALPGAGLACASVDSPPGRTPAMWLIPLVSFAWGFLEATCFFIVPDVWLTWIVLSDGKRACRQAVWALAGALVGGTVVYLWGSLHPEQAALLTLVPGIGPEMVAGVAEDLQRSGGMALLIGPLKGIPYKLYAFHSSRTVGFIPFILISIPARLSRFLAVTGFAWFVSRAVLGGTSARNRKVCLVLCWVVFYVFYFSVMP